MKVAFLGGGTGGHLAPAIGVAEELHRRGIETVVLEHRTREHVLGRIRAGILEVGFIVGQARDQYGYDVLGAPQLYLFEPHQTEQMGWKPDTFLDITPVWDKKRAAIECMEGQEHLWEFYTRVAQQRKWRRHAEQCLDRLAALSELSDD